ncbi:hypothetical protein B484DRAFT_148949 [Ochromonadaceae sp. CCMP2298]|nr:hypothetical protein B484DRAFT_148949 [Ochromonadaceae sp. CCMP2298]
MRTTRPAHAPQTEQLYTYFVRRHLNRLASKCQEISKHRQAEREEGEEVTAVSVYRDEIYGRTLASVNVNRFYACVPICQMCHVVYSALDAERDRGVLGPGGSKPRSERETGTGTHTGTATNTGTSAGTNTGTGTHAGMGAGIGAGLSVPVPRRITLIAKNLGKPPEEQLWVSPPKPFHRERMQDPYEQDDCANTVDFIPHHSAQRDVWHDFSKKQTSSMQVRQWVRQQIADKQTDPLSPPRTPPTPTRTPAVLTLQRLVKSRTTFLHTRKPVDEKRDRIPQNIADTGRLNHTSDGGIGSRGPQHGGRVEASQSASLSKAWVQLLHRRPKRKEPKESWRRIPVVTKRPFPTHPSSPPSPSAMGGRALTPLPTHTGTEQEAVSHVRPRSAGAVAPHQHQPLKCAAFAAPSDYHARTRTPTLIPTLIPTFTPFPHPTHYSHEYAHEYDREYAHEYDPEYAHEYGAPGPQQLGRMEREAAGAVLRLRQSMPQSTQAFSRAYAYASLPFMTAPVLATRDGPGRWEPSATHTQTHTQTSTHSPLEAHTETPMHTQTQTLSPSQAQTQAQWGVQAPVPFQLLRDFLLPSQRDTGDSGKSGKSEKSEGSEKSGESGGESGGSGRGPGSGDTGDGDSHHDSHPVWAPLLALEQTALMGIAEVEMEEKEEVEVGEREEGVEGAQEEAEGGKGVVEEVRGEGERTGEEEAQKLETEKEEKQGAVHEVTPAVLAAEAPLPSTPPSSPPSSPLRQPEPDGREEVESAEGRGSGASTADPLQDPFPLSPLPSDSLPLLCLDPLEPLDVDPLSPPPSHSAGSLGDLSLSRSPFPAIEL